jgi:trehalose 6-phosphate synthase/phosphatase
MLETMLAQTDLRAVRGNRVVEVKPLWANKGQALDRIAALCPEAAFQLAMGDDRTDEDLFERLPDGWTIRVGRGESRARFSLPGPAAARRLLETLAAARQ